METNVDKTVATLLHEHALMLRAVREMRLALLQGSIGDACKALDTLQRLHAAHIAVEEAHWIVRLGPGARWQPKVYLAEHAKLEQMILDWRRRLTADDRLVVEPLDRLELLDASLPLQHLLEHHFEREEKGLFVEINA
ncbi:Hemerythrin HHE cation binding domain [Thiomonas bhubaneswarensis]|uniref:Hemerythrin HHE cation binding domain n=1 Tax=Thiomonas bhubaneswarensis TaxID=339866 RepID=A0A0K6I8K3_9BURK|nr:Hemerythrin HHE cation binding domain [Thiomonas bhubaneswarensis]